MKRGNMAWDVMILSSLFFLVGLQPWALVVASRLPRQQWLNNEIGYTEYVNNKHSEENNR